MARGKPTKYRHIFNKRAKDFLAKGYSNRVLAGHLQVNESTLYAWIKTHDSFKQSIVEGKALGEKRLIDMCLNMGDGTTKANFNSVAFLLKNIHRYSDNPVVDDEEKKPIEITFSVSTPSKED